LIVEDGVPGDTAIDGLGVGFDDGEVLNTSAHVCRPNLTEF